MEYFFYKQDGFYVVLSVAVDRVEYQQAAAIFKGTDNIAISYYSI